MDPLHLLFPVFLARSDSKVNEKAEGTLCDGYTKSACINLHAVVNIFCEMNNIVALTETVEVGCPRHPGATTIGNQLQDGDRTDGGKT